MRFLTKEQFLAAENSEPSDLSSEIKGYDLNAPPGGLVLPATPMMVNNYARIHGIHGSYAKADLLYEAGLRWKEDAGVLLDYSDCRLATAERQACSVVDEFAMVLPSN